MLKICIECHLVREFYIFFSDRELYKNNFWGLKSHIFIAFCLFSFGMISLGLKLWSKWRKPLYEWVYKNWQIFYCMHFWTNILNWMMTNYTIEEKKWRWKEQKFWKHAYAHLLSPHLHLFYQSDITSAKMRAVLNQLISFLLLNFCLAKPNFLLIIVDDLRPALGCYSDGASFTPNIDRIAKNGITFRRAYAQVRNKLIIHTHSSSLFTDYRVSLNID